LRQDIHSPTTGIEKLNRCKNFAIFATLASLREILLAILNPLIIKNGSRKDAKVAKIATGNPIRLQTQSIFASDSRMI
jgi:hypothetical protein